MSERVPLMSRPFGFQEAAPEEHPDILGGIPEAQEKPVDNDILKTRIETLDLSLRTQNALEEANIRTLGGLVRKKKDDILELDGIGPKGLDEIVAILKNFNLSFKE